MSFINELLQEHGSEVEQQLTSQLGLTPQQAASVLPQVAPLILGGLKQNLVNHGPEHVESHLQQFGATDFSDIGAVLRGGQAGGMDLGGLLGGKSDQATQHVAQKLGISAGMAAKIIPMVAPLIIGMLMKKGRSPGTGGGQTGGGGGGGLISILDRDGDGSIIDDLGSMITGGGSGPGANKAGCLSAILGGLLRGKR